ncbi:MAG TPA: M12 family metallo-peptidase [Candidatus Limnocylindrales bacterium]|nr:M12 family metallo-peptidase [Candidatus Limnocylindrales bacterium]
MSRQTVAVAPVVAFCLAAAIDALAAPPLFFPATEDLITTTLQAVPAVKEGIAGRALRERLVLLEAGLLERSSTVELNLFDDVRVFARRTALTYRAGGMLSWSGKLEGVDVGQAVAVVAEDGIVARVQVDYATFEVEPAANGLHWIRQLQPQPIYGDGEPLRASHGHKRRDFPDVTHSLPSVRERHSDVINVLVVYTNRIATFDPAAEAKIQLAVDAANDAYDNSGMITRIRLAHVAGLDYPEVSPDPAAIVPSLRDPGDGVLDEVHALRNAYLADLVVFVSHTSDNVCGRAYLMQDVDVSFESSAFSMVLFSCLPGGLTLAHELGHNMGCQHDRVNAGSVPAFPYAYGYQEPRGDFRTVMASFEGCAGSCPQIPYFANPEVLYEGAPTGVAAGSADAAACAMAIDQTYETVKRFRELIAPTGITTSSDLTDAVRIDVIHPWPYRFRIYRSLADSPLELIADGVESSFLDRPLQAGIGYQYFASAVTADGQESDVFGPVLGTPLVPTCGNGLLETPAEECDDANTEAVDGCSPSCSREPRISQIGEACIGVANRTAINVSSMQARQSLSCLSDAQAARDDFGDCVDSPNDSLAAARDDAIASEWPECSKVEYGYAGMAAAIDAAVAERTALLEDLFGRDISAAPVIRSQNSSGARCQKLTVKAVDGVMAKYMRRYTACTDVRIDQGKVTAPQSFAYCLTAAPGDTPKEDRLLFRALDKLERTVLLSCAPTELARLLPGQCATSSPQVFTQCMHRGVICRACRIYRQAGELPFDCDVIDDGTANGSCAP